MSQKALSTLIIFLFALSRANCTCEDSLINADIFYSCQLPNNLLEGGEFGVQRLVARLVPVTFHVSERGHPGIPQWLTLSRSDNATSPSYIYGTPRAEDVGILVLEILAQREDTYNTTMTAIQLTISPPEGSILETTELYIKNYELSEFISVEVNSLFKRTLSTAYQQLLTLASPLLLRVINPLSRGVPLPFPPEKLGVIVQVAPGLNANTLVASIETTCESTFSQTFVDNGFQLENCTSITSTMSPGQSTDPTTDVVTSVRPFPPSSGNSISLVVILVLGAVILVMIITGLAWVCFGRRKKGFHVSHEKRVQKSTMHNVAKTTSSGPVKAQVHLRDLAQSSSPTKQKQQFVAMEAGRPQSVSSSEALLVFHDLTDYSSQDTSASSRSQQPLPAYTYPDIPGRNP